jgi:uncharacterized protein
MFKRRNPLPLHKRAGEIVWPSGGWRRSGAYVAHRLRRLPGTPYRIAAGFASGAAISFTPFIGLHFVLAAVIAVLVRGNVIAAAIGTVVGNPWTFPFIWLWIYSLGSWVLGDHGLTELPEDLSFQIFENPMEVLLPMVVGGIPTAIAAWFVFFWPLQRTIAEYQKARRRLLRRRMRKRQALAATARSRMRPDPTPAKAQKFESLK